MAPDPPQTSSPTSPLLRRKPKAGTTCFRDKSKGLGSLAAKCRVVALGHKDPDIYRLNRECATPNRTSEHVRFVILTAGTNGEFAGSKKKWRGWSGDAATAFLQGDLSQTERELPLYLLPPSDGITELTSCWKALLYMVCTNVYGLSNAPRLWSLTVIKRLTDLNYRQHSFDEMVFIKRDSRGEPISSIIVYVDDFLGVYRSDYNVDEVYQAFKWGALQNFEVDKPVTFKGKQITLKQRANGRHYLHVCQKEFISGMAAGKIPLELSAVNSLSNHGGATTVGDLKAIYEAVNFAASTKDNGFVVVIPDVPVNKESIVITSSSPSATPLGQTPRTAAPSAGCLCYCVRSRLTPCFLTGAAADLKESAGPPWLQKLPQQTKAATGRLHQPLSQRRPLKKWFQEAPSTGSLLH